MTTKTVLNLKWDNIDFDTKVQILSNACLNTRFAYYKWDEIEEWIQFMIKDNMEVRSKKTVTIGQ
jgi:hypothetical protein